MDCAEAKNHLLDRRRGTLEAVLRAQLDAHLAECELCRREDAADHALSVALDEHLPKRPLPPAFRRSIEERFATAPSVAASAASNESRERGPNERTERSQKGRASRRVFVIALAAALAAAAAWLFAWNLRAPDSMVAEAVNDHLRILYSSHPLEVESGGVHQVKPWFEGRVDFAPVVGFGGDDDFPLQGGAVAYFVDRKAAAYVFKRRLHVITLFVYPADGLPWSSLTRSTVSLGHVRAVEQTTRGFHVLLWRDGDLGYSLVSDLDPRELEALGAKIAGG